MNGTRWIIGLLVGLAMTALGAVGGVSSSAWVRTSENSGCIRALLQHQTDIDRRLSLIEADIREALRILRAP